MYCKHCYMALLNKKNLHLKIIESEHTLLFNLLRPLLLTYLIISIQKSTAFFCQVKRGKGPVGRVWEIQLMTLPLKFYYYQACTSEICIVLTMEPFSVWRELWVPIYASYNEKHIHFLEWSLNLAVWTQKVRKIQHFRWLKVTILECIRATKF